MDYGVALATAYSSPLFSEARHTAGRQGRVHERSALSFFSQAVSFTSFSFFVPEPVQLCGHVKTQQRDILNGALCAPVFFVVAFFPSYTYYIVEAHGC